MIYLFPIFISHFFFSSTSTAQTDGGTVTIASAPAFSTLRGCVQTCLWGGCNANIVDVGCSIGCGLALVPSYLNNCFCRTDLAPSASSIISACVTHGCSPGPGPDASAGVSLYASYCQIVFPTTTAAASPITLRPGNGVPTTTNSAGETSEMVFTTTVVVDAGGSSTTSGAGSSSRSSSTSNSLSQSDVIAIVMGILAVLATGLAAFVSRHTVVRIVRENTSIFS